MHILILLGMIGFQVSPAAHSSTPVKNFGSLCLSARANGPKNMGHTHVEYIRSGREGIGPATLILLESPQGVPTADNALHKMLTWSQESKLAKSPNSNLCFQSKSITVHLKKYCMMNFFEKEASN